MTSRSLELLTYIFINIHLFFEALHCQAWVDHVCVCEAVVNSGGPSHPECHVSFATNLTAAIGSMMCGAGMGVGLLGNSLL